MRSQWTGQEAAPTCMRRMSARLGWLGLLAVGQDVGMCMCPLTNHPRSPPLVWYCAVNCTTLPPHSVCMWVAATACVWLRQPWIVGRPLCHVPHSCPVNPRFMAAIPCLHPSGSYLLSLLLCGNVCCCLCVVLLCSVAVALTHVCHVCHLTSPTVLHYE